MATFTEVTKRVKLVVHLRLVNKYTTLNQLKEVYFDIKKQWSVTSVRSGRVRNWGSGANEKFESFAKACALEVFGIEKWPEEEEEHVRDFMAEYRISAADVNNVRFLQRHGYWDAFVELRDSKSRTSWQYFDDVKLFARVVRLTGDEMLNEHPRTWISVRRAIQQYPTWNPRVGTKRVVTDEHVVKIIKLIKAGYSRRCLLSLLDELPDELIDEVKQYCQSLKVYEFAQKGIVPKERVKEWFKHSDFVNNSVVSVMECITKFTPNPIIDAIQDPTVQIGLYAGKTPKECIGPVLDELFTNKTAHEFIFKYGSTYLGDKKFGGTYKTILASFNTVHKFMSNYYGIPFEYLDRLRRANVLLIEWLARKWSNAAMSKERVIHGPGGQTKVYTYLEILDELTSADLVNSINTSPDVAFANSARRIEQIYKSSLGEKVYFPASPFTHNEHITYIDNTEDLRLEGKTMHHCVGGYTRSCVDNMSKIYHVNVDDEHATFEIAYRGVDTWELVQNKGTGNSDPSREVWAIVLDWCEENNIIHDRFITRR